MNLLTSRNRFYDIRHLMVLFGQKMFQDNFSQLMLVNLPNFDIFEKLVHGFTENAILYFFEGDIHIKNFFFFFTVYDNAVVCTEDHYFVCLFHKRGSDWLIINDINSSNLIG